MPFGKSSKVPKGNSCSRQGSQYIEEEEKVSGENQKKGAAVCM
jgi:hypothetical protein